MELNDVSLIDTLIDIGNLVDRAIEIKIRRLNLSSAQLRILEALDRAERADRESNGIQPKDLAAMLIQEAHSVSGLLNRLEDRELIQRGRDKTDRRAVFVQLTGQGRELVAAAAADRATVEAQARSLLDVDAVGLALCWRQMLRELLAGPAPVGRVAV